MSCAFPNSKGEVMKKKIIVIALSLVLFLATSVSVFADDEIAETRTYSLNDFNITQSGVDLFDVQIPYNRLVINSSSAGIKNVSLKFVPKNTIALNRDRKYIVTFSYRLNFVNELNFLRFVSDVVTMSDGNRQNIVNQQVPPTNRNIVRVMSFVVDGNSLLSVRDMEVYLEHNFAKMEFVYMYDMKLTVSEVRNGVLDITDAVDRQTDKILNESFGYVKPANPKTNEGLDKGNSIIGGINDSLANFPAQMEEGSDALIEGIGNIAPVINGAFGALPTIVVALLVGVLAFLIIRKVVGR